MASWQFGPTRSGVELDAAHPAGTFGVAIIAVVVVQAVLSSHHGVLAYREMATGGLASSCGALRRRQQTRASTPKV